MRCLKKLLVFALSFAWMFLHAQEDTTTLLIERYTLEELLQTPIVSAKKKNQLLEEVSASVLVLTKEDIERYGILSINDLINHITGFYMIDDYYWMGNVNFGVRGFYNVGIASNLVILVNGVSQLSDEYGDYPDTKITVPIEAVKRVEVVKGPVSVLYGSGGFFGAINIITHDKGEDECLEMNASAGNNLKGKVYLGLNGSNKDVTYSVYASASETRGVDVPYGSLTSDTDLLNEHGLTPESRTGGQLGRQKKYFGSVITARDITFDLSYNETVKGIMDGVPNFGIGSEITHAATNFVLRHEMEIGSRLSSRFQTGYYFHTHNVDYEEFFQYYYRQDYKKSRSYDIEGNLFYSPLPNLDLDLGIYYRRLFDLFQMVNSSYYSLNSADGEVGIPRDDFMSTQAAYLQADWQITDYLKITGGMRAEHLRDYDMYYARGIVTRDTTFNRTDPASPANRLVQEQTYMPPNNGLQFIPRAGIVMAPWDFMNLKLLYGKSIRQPNFIDNIRQMIMDDSRFLNPQNIETYEANLVIRPFKHVQIQSIFFYNKLNNLISASNIYNRQTGVWEIRSANSGEMSTLGAETGILVSALPRTEIIINSLIQRTNVLSEGYSEEAPGYSPNFIGYAKFAYRLTNHVCIGTKMKYMGAMQSKWDFVGTPENGFRVGAGSDPWFVIDLNLSHRNIRATGLYANLNFMNITNTEIRYPTTESNVWIDKGTLGLGFRWMLTLGWELK